MKKTVNRLDNQEGFVLIAALLILLVLTVMGIAVNRGTMTEWRIAMNDREQKETFYEADAATELAAEVLVQNIACMGFNENEKGMVLRGVDKDHHAYIKHHAVGFWRFYAPDGTAVPSYGLDRDVDGVLDGVPNGEWDCDTDSTPDEVGNNVSMDYDCPTNRTVPAWDIVYPAAFKDGSNELDPDPADFSWEKTIKGESGEPFVNNKPFALIKIGGETKAKKGSALEMSAGYLGLGQGIAGGGTELVYNINVRQRGRNGSESVLCIRYAHVLGNEGNCNYTAP